MSYSRRQLYAMGETFGESATRREVGGKVIYGSGGGGGTPANTSQKQTVTQDLPAWAQPYAKESLGKAQALSATPYQVYGGERIAQFTPLQKQAFGRAEGQQVADQIGAGSGLAGTAGLMGLTGGYQPGQFGSQMSQYMSPYMDAVVQQQMESAQRQADIAGTQRGAQAVRAGAFGGSRQAVENAEAARALASQKGQIQATGLQSAYDRATDMYGREQALAEQSRQAGLQTALGAAGQLGQLGQQQFGQQMDITGQQFGFGQQQRAATQDILSQQYQDFLNQQRAPYDQLAFMTSMIRGTPMGGTTAQYSTAPAPSYTSQLIGLGTAAAGAYGAYKGAAGGEIPSYAAGGIASLSQPEMASAADGMSDQQLQQTQGLPSITDLAKMTLKAEEDERARVREAQKGIMAQMNQQPQGTVAEEQMAAINAMDQGLGGLDVPDDLVGNEYTAAGGGIVAFETGGDVDLEKQREEDRARLKSMYEAGRISLEEFGRAIADIAALPLRGVAGAYDSAVVRPMRAAGLDAGYLSPYLVPEGVDPKSMTPFSDQMRSRASAVAPATSGIAALADGSDNRFQRGPVVAGITDQPPAPTGPGATGSGAAPGAAPRDTGPGAAPSMPSGGLAGLLKDIKTREAQLRDEATKASDIEAAGLEKERTALEAAKEEAKKYGTEQEEKYKKRGERLEKDEKQNPYMSLIEAGLAIAAGESPNALKNLAVGAQQGLKGYQARLEKVNEGRDNLDEAMFKLYNIRNDKVTAAGDKLRELNRAETKVKADAVRSLSEISKGMFGEEIKLKTKQIDQMFEMSKTRFEQGQATERAKLTADRGDPVLRRAAYQGLQEELENNQRLLMAYSNNPEKAEAARQEIRRIKGEMDALLPSGGGKVTGSSTLPSGFKLD
jgi:hypothetical protein